MKNWLLISLFLVPFLLSAQNRTLSLNGEWQVEEGSLSSAPEAYGHTVPVPGLIKQATPAFPNVGELASKSFRQAFWYRRTFEIEGSSPQRAILKINKAKYGVKVFLNGDVVGESLACFTPLQFDVASALRGNGETNELVVRLGHWIDSIPPTHPAGFDREKLYYYPGIYDDVSLILSESPHIGNVQTVSSPDDRSVRAVIELHNTYDRSRAVALNLTVREKESGREVGRRNVDLRIAGDSSETVDVVLPIEDCRLWSPEDPFLYELAIDATTDSRTVTFGVREFHFDRATGRPMLNGKPYYLRGTNICIFRFMDDDACKDHPWNEAWVRKFIRSLKEEMGWNSARFCIGFPPELWYRIADEEGLLVQDEFPLWTFRYARYGPPMRGEAGREISVAPELMPQFQENLTAQARDWMRERWNHASVVIWDIQNETVMTEVTGNVIQAVRGMDLSGRPWDNGESPMQSASDPLELHIYPYVFPSKWPCKPIPPFTMADIPKYADIPLSCFLSERVKGDTPPMIVNEYVALWVNRDGSSCTHSIPHFERILGEDNTAENRWKLSAQSVAAMTELFRNHWRVAGVMQFCALGYSRPNAIFLEGATCDFMVDVDNIVFHPYYSKVVADAFAPVGLMLDEWSSQLPAGRKYVFEVSLVNDLYEDWNGELRLLVQKDGRTIASSAIPAGVESLGTASLTIEQDLPAEPGAYTLVAEIRGGGIKPVQSIREVDLVAASL